MGLRPQRLKLSRMYSQSTLQKNWWSSSPQNQLIQPQLCSELKESLYDIITTNNLTLLALMCLRLIIMMIARALRLTRAVLTHRGKMGFSHPRIPVERFQLIKDHSLHTEYEGVNPVTTQHLPNNVRIIEDETKLKFLVEEGGFPGCADLGILFRVGSQNETDSTAGSLDALKNLVHMKPDFRDSIRNYEFMNQTGATVDFNYDVQNSYIRCSFFQEDIDIMLDLVLDLALREKKLFQEELPTDPSIADINEQLRVTAFGGKGIGMPSNGVGNVLTNSQFLQFQREFITPHDTVISMSNVKNPDQLIAKIKLRIQERFPQFLKRVKPQPAVSNYQGGIARLQVPQTPFFEFAAAVPGCQYKNPKMELYNLLRIILGSASSFSSGGPGKGMHSRCTKNLLNREPCIESASYHLGHYEHFGLFGIVASGPHEQANDVVNVALRELNLLKQPIPQEELQRAKNILIAGIYANIERQSDRLEQISKHLNSYGKVRLWEFEEHVRKITARDVQAEMKAALQLPPTFVLRGTKKSIKVASDRNLLSRLRA